MLAEHSGRFFRWLAAAACCVVPVSVPASTLFQDDSVIEVELTGPFHRLISNTESRETRVFRMEANGIATDIDIRIRGKSRVRVCEFPPLRLHIREDRADDPVFGGLGRLKLVTHCRNTDNGESNAIEEYLAYRIFGLLSPVGYRVRLLRLHYKDTDGKLDSGARQRFGFVIEPGAQLAERTGGDLLELPGVALGRMNREQAALVYVFQYLIGNTDWSFVVAEGDDACCHNGDLIEIESQIFYLPYDFDLAGLVNAPYAKPAKEMKIPHVRSRRYRGFCEDRETLLEAVRRVKSSEAEILQLVQDVPGLTSRERRRAADYLLQFFEKARDEEKLMKSYERRCLEPRTALRLPWRISAPRQSARGA